MRDGIEGCGDEGDEGRCDDDGRGGAARGTVTCDAGGGAPEAEVLPRPGGAPAQLTSGGAP
ncbi:UNVERIFIED_CONTAM: hypothetical protein Sangu_2646700 [Sesamum angustifolium]|uniref:Uncharacterized protein n=1 Tax=Sesamum angustifolium TaxID=2727405 RepID=A0AAW2J2K4_9LAMI